MAEFRAPQPRPISNPITDQSSSDDPPIPPLPYKPPEWSGLPTKQYSFEVLKNGVIIETTECITKDFVTFGRLPICDVSLEHQSISRYHAIVQFKSDGSVYLYDLGSSHGTELNKNVVAKKKYVRIRVGDMIRFGQSSRVFILMGPVDDKLQEEPVHSNNSHADTSNALKARDEVTWGFSQDAYEGDEFEGIRVDAKDLEDISIDQDAYYVADPRKSLRVWFESRGEELAFRFEEEGYGQNKVYVARINVPVQTQMGSVFGTGKGARKKEAERNACLDCCAKLDKLGILRGSVADSENKQKRRLKDLYGDDGDDAFFDRTKDQHKKQQFGAQEQKTDNFESLTEKKKSILTQIASLEAQIASNSKSKLFQKNHFGLFNSHSHYEQ